MTASKVCMNKAGLKLISDLERCAMVCTNRLNYEDYNYHRGDVEAIQRHLRNAVARLRFLEMAVLGLTHGELRIAADKADKLLRAQDTRKMLDSIVPKR